jgi:hypothetical protein
LITVLSSTDATPLPVIGERLVEYLEGECAVAGERRPGTLVELPSPEGGTVAYYADSAGLRPGRWVLGRSGEVDPVELVTLLAGVDPATGELLVDPMVGSRKPAKGGSAPGNSVLPQRELRMFAATTVCPGPWPGVRWTGF